MGYEHIEILKCDEEATNTSYKCGLIGFCRRNEDPKDYHDAILIIDTCQVFVENEDFIGAVSVASVLGVVAHITCIPTTDSSI